MTPKELNEAGWELAGDCLDILPADNLSVTGLALIHIVAVWLNAIPGDIRALAYMQWLDMLHQQLDRAGVMTVKSVSFDEGSGEDITADPSGSGQASVH